MPPTVEGLQPDHKLQEPCSRPCWMCYVQCTMTVRPAGTGLGESDEGNEAQNLP